MLLNLGDFVWNDLNNNGIQDAGEPGIGGVTVNLYTDNNADNIPDRLPIATTTTNSNGIYGFSGLTAGNYIVGIVAPFGFAPSSTTATSANPNNDNNTDNNGVNTVGNELRSNYITLTYGGEPFNGGYTNLTMDFGLKGLCSPPSITTQPINVSCCNTAPSSGGINLPITPYSNVSFNPGAYIIDMGQNSSVNIGLKPYGLVYALIQANIPVYLVINPLKLKDGVDFTYKGTGYREVRLLLLLKMPLAQSYKVSLLLGKLMVYRL